MSNVTTPPLDASPASMTNEEVKHRIWRNTLSNYTLIVLRLGVGIVMFRLLYQKLGREEFGFWALLWSVFGYGVLLDFGFGFTAQKRVAELSVHQDWTRLSQVLSTIFFCYVAIGAMIVLAGLAGAGAFVDWLQVTESNRAEFERTLRVFLCGVGLAFPLGLFPEILRGLQHIRLSNILFAAGMLTNFVFVLLALWLGWSLCAIVVIALVCTFVPDLICGGFALRQLPRVRILPSYFSRGMVRDTMSFSVFAYVITVSNIILGRTDQLLISTTLAVSTVAIYQAGAKIADMFATLGHQLPETLSPAAAHLHARGDRGFLRRLLVDGTRITAMVATPVYLLSALYMDLLLGVLTGDPASRGEIYWTAQVLLLWSYIGVTTQGVSKRIFMMCGHERRLMWLSVGEAMMNLVLSIALVLWFKNVICVAVGSLISTWVFGWLFLWPWAAREAGLSGIQLAKAVLAPAWTACLPVFAVFGAAKWIVAGGSQAEMPALLMQATLASALVMWCVWNWGLTAAERSRVLVMMGRAPGQGRTA